MKKHKHNLPVSDESFQRDPGSFERIKKITDEMRAGFRFAEMFDEVRVVTCYGSARASQDTKHYQMAYNLGQRLAQDDDPIAVSSGGGPGIMEAVNKGAYDAGGISIGLGIKLDKIVEEPNIYTTHRMDFQYFFARKVILAHIAQAYIFFPGGVGTLDEFFELATLVTTKKMETGLRIILMDAKYWKGLFRWLEHTATEKYAAFSKSHFDLFHITSDVDEAYHLLDRLPTRIARSDAV